MNDNTLGKIWKALNATLVKPQLLPQCRKKILVIKLYSLRENCVSHILAEGFGVKLKI